MTEPKTPEQTIEAARLAGFDLSLVECNLALSTEERLERHDDALGLALAFYDAGRRLHAQSTPPPFAPR